MFKLECESGSGGSEVTVLKVSGDMSMSHAEEVKSALLQVIETNLKVLVDLEKVTKIDLTAIQLLCAAHRYATRKNRTFAFALPPKGNVRDALIAAGYSRHVGCIHDEQGSCIWLSCRGDADCGSI